MMRAAQSRISSVISTVSLVAGVQPPPAASRQQTQRQPIVSDAQAQFAQQLHDQAASAGAALRNQADRLAGRITAMAGGESLRRH